MTYSKVGDKPKQGERPVWKGALNVERSCTDMPFFILFALVIAFWLVIATYVFSVGEIVEAHRSNVLIHKHLYYISLYITENLYEVRYIVVGFVTMSFLLLAGLASLYRWATRGTVYATMFFMFVMLALLYALISCCIHRGTVDYVMIAPLTIAAIIYVVLMYVVLKAGVASVCGVITESCQAIFFFPSTIVFMFCQFVLHVVVAVFAYTLFVYLHDNGVTEDIYDEQTGNWTSAEVDEMTEATTEAIEDVMRVNVVPQHTCLFEWVNVCGFIWANLFITGLGRMVLSSTFATWHHEEDKRSLPYTTIGRCFVQTVVHHLGTIAYASSFLWIFPMFYIVFKFERERLRELYKRPVLILSWLVIILKFPYDALTMCAIHGDSFYESAKRSYILTMKNPMSTLVSSTITECVISTGSLLMPVLTLTLNLTYEIYVCDYYSECSAAVFVCTLVSLIMSLTFFMVFRAALNTLRLCQLEDSKFAGENEMTLYEMHVDEVVVRNDLSVY